MVMCFTVLAVITLRNKLNLQKEKEERGVGWWMVVEVGRLDGHESSCQQGG